MARVLTLTTEQLVNREWLCEPTIPWWQRAARWGVALLLLPINVVFMLLIALVVMPVARVALRTALCARRRAEAKACSYPTRAWRVPTTVIVLFVGPFVAFQVVGLVLAVAHPSDPWAMATHALFSFWAGRALFAKQHGLKVRTALKLRRLRDRPFTGY